MNSPPASPSQLHITARDFFTSVIEPFPTTIKTVFGQNIKLITQNGTWVKSIKFEHIGYGVISINWGDTYHNNEIMEWLLRSWIIDRLQLRIDLRPIKLITNELEIFQQSFEHEREFRETVCSWLFRVANRSLTPESYDTLISAKLFHRWCIEEGIPEFEEITQLELESIRGRQRASANFVAMRDEDEGPFTRSELSLIEQALQTSSAVSSAQRAQYYLSRDWGLRPIQLALLRAGDFGIDELGPYIKIPSVKGIRRARLRRSPGNLVKRYISDDTAEAIRAQCELTRHECNLFLQRLEHTGKLSLENFDPPLFPSFKKSTPRIERMLAEPNLAPYMLHADSTSISRSIRNLTRTLKIPKPRGKNPNYAFEYLEISSYRLRRTKGTAMVLAGNTAEEVAEALDHSNTESVKYYFRYNLDLHDFINKTHTNSLEIQRAVELWGSRIVKPDSSSGMMPVSSLGLCSLGAPCPAHPTLSCYSCPSFHPSQSGNHEEALVTLLNFQSMLSSTSTGPLVLQVEGAIQGARAVLLAITKGSENDQ